MNEELPDIIQEKVDLLGKISLCSRTDIYLAAKKLIILANSEENITDKRISVLLEQVVETAALSNQTAYKVAFDMENLVAVSKLKPYVSSTWKTKIKHYISRVKYNVKTIFGFIPWVDYKTRKWWKL